MIFTPKNLVLAAAAALILRRLMPARRCPTCFINYPPTNGVSTSHLRCAVCGRSTDYINNAQPHSDWKRQAFETYYRIHDGARQGPSPDDVGREHARALTEQFNAIREAYGSEPDIS